MKETEKYELWLARVTDAEVRAQLESMRGDENAIVNAFYKDLEFGTGGLRGELGAGTNCLNVYTIRKVTQGIADCMKRYGFRTAAISRDSRIGSDRFAAAAAEVFAANGITAYVTHELMPTPFLSYMTRETKSDIGVMITASHNPSKYNGYKVYGADGCQLTDARAAEMTGYIEAVDPFDVPVKPFEAGLKDGSIRYIDDGLIDRYIAAVREQSLGSAAGVRVVYSALNGTGYKLVPRILREVGASDVTEVSEQCRPDGRFPTCPYPNPEKPEALRLGLELTEKIGADILIATDPDADRIGVAVRTADGCRLLTGNETGVLLTDYIFARRKERGTLPDRPVLVKTIVTTELGFKVAEKYRPETYDVLTGFKYIGDVIGKLEKKGEESRFVFGFEESYGCLAGTYVRDKDAVVAAMLVAEMAAYYKNRGLTLVDRIEEIYAEFGTYQHKLVSKEFPGAEGHARMQTLLENLRRHLPETLAGAKVTEVIDYLVQEEFDLPKSNVLSLKTDTGTRLVIRPSGTEPLIKFYITASRTPAENEKTVAAVLGWLDETFV